MNLDLMIIVVELVVAAAAAAMTKLVMIKFPQFMKCNTGCQFDTYL